MNENIYGVGVEELKIPLYSTKKIRRCDGKLEFFQGAIGINGDTYATTNMDLPCQLPKGRRYIVNGFEVQTNLQRDFFDSSYYRFFVGCKEYQHGRGINLINNMESSFSNLLIESNQNFFAEINFNSKLQLNFTGVIIFIIHGTMIRPIY